MKVKGRAGGHATTRTPRDLFPWIRTFWIQTLFGLKFNVSTNCGTYFSIGSILQTHVWYFYRKLKYLHGKLQYRGTRWRVWLRHCTTRQKVEGSIPDGVTGIFDWHNPSSCSMVLGSTQPLTEMSTRNISWWVKEASASGWQLYHLHALTVLKYGSLKLLEPSGPIQACNGITLNNNINYSYPRSWMETSGYFHAAANSSQYPFDMNLCGPQNRSGHFRVIIILSLSGFNPLDRPLYRLANLLTTL